MEEDGGSGKWEPMRFRPEGQRCEASSDASFFVAFVVVFGVVRWIVVSRLDRRGASYRGSSDGRELACSCGCCIAGRQRATASAAQGFDPLDHSPHS